MSETIHITCDNCGAIPAYEGSPAALRGWARTKMHFWSTPNSAMTVGTPLPDLDLCPDCVGQLRLAKANGYPNAPERVA